MGVKFYTEKFGENIPIKYHPIIRREESCYISSSKAIELAKKIKDENDIFICINSWLNFINLLWYNIKSFKSIGNIDKFLLILVFNYFIQLFIYINYLYLFIYVSKYGLKAYFIMIITEF